MEKEEVIRRLREHLKSKKLKSGKLCKYDKNFSIKYVMDCLLLTREQALEFLKKHIPSVVNL